MGTDLECLEKTLPVAEAAAFIQDCAKAVGGSGWIIVQSFVAIRFKVWTPGSSFPLDFGTIYNGRIFGANAEVRWVRDGDHVTVWRLREVPGTDFERQFAKYYLWGRYNTKDKRFSEDTVRGLLDYPTLPRIADDDRPYVEVFEYTDAEPKAVMSTAGELMDLLNRPRVAAHRFVRFGCGKD